METNLLLPSSIYLQDQLKLLYGLGRHHPGRTVSFYVLKDLFS